VVQMGSAQDRSRDVGLGRDRAQPVLLPTRTSRVLRGILDGIRKSGSSIARVDRSGRRRRARRTGSADICPKLDGELAAAMMRSMRSKASSSGAGFGAPPNCRREECRRRAHGNNGTRFVQHAVGVLGGISTASGGVSFAVKPTSSIPVAAPTVDRTGHDTSHDQVPPDHCGRHPRGDGRRAMMACGGGSVMRRGRSAN